VAALPLQSPLPRNIALTPINRFLSIGFDKTKLVPVMKRRGICALLLTSAEDVFYTTGYTTLPSSGNPILYALRNRLPSFSVIDADGRVTLLCWGFSAEGVELGADEVVGFNQFVGALEALKSVLMRNRGSEGLIGVTSSCPYFVLQVLEECALRDKLSVVDDLMEELRLIKSEEEILRLRRSTEITELAYREVFGLLRLGMGRSELAREAKSSLIKNGATGISHVTLSFTQANPEIDIDERLEKNRLVTIDIGGIYHGYCSDTRRYAYTGSVPESLRKRYERMVQIVDTVGEALVPGRSFEDIFRLALDQYANHGIKQLARFNHIGHSIGLETEERWLDDSPYLVKSGMVINIELYSTADTGEQIGNEDTYVIGESGPSRISHLPREIRAIG
jgi:Xaa-Pro aminopeptidase